MYAKHGITVDELIKKLQAFKGSDLVVIDQSVKAFEGPYIQLDSLRKATLVNEGYNTYVDCVCLFGSGDTYCNDQGFLTYD